MRATLTTFGAVGAALALGLIAGPAAAGPVIQATEETVVLGCGARAKLVTHLEERYGEVFSGQSQESEQGLVELFVAESGSWTMLLSLPNGQACPLAVGSDAERDFERSEPIGEPV